MGVHHPKAIVNDVIDYYDMVSIIIEKNDIAFPETN